MDTTAALRLAPGVGVVARRPTAMLFSPGHDDALCEAFVTSPTGAELQAVASATVGAGFAVGAYVAVSWGAELQVMAFGDVAVETDQPSMPMLTGAGSRTWVEHWLQAHDGAVIDVRPDGAVVDPATDLGAGVAPAGGFQLELRAAGGPMPTAVGQPAGAGQPTTALPRLGGADAPQVPAGIGLDDPDVTLPPPPTGRLISDARADHPLVDAKRCRHGHPSPPTATRCGRCGELLDPGSDEVVQVVRPRLGRIRFDDGEDVELEHELLIGRSPDRDDRPERAGLRRTKVHGDKVSRSHLEIRFQGWDVLIADCGSTNGTFVVAHPGWPVATVVPGTPQLLERGATVYFGSRSFTLLGRDAP